MRVFLFLDIDGVLLPAPPADSLAYTDVDLDPERHDWGLVRVLAMALDAFPDVRVVVSSSWARFHDLETLQRVLAPLPIVDVIARRIGTRYEDVRSYMYKRAEPWLALDDDDRGWPDEDRHRLVHCQEQVGLRDATRIGELVQKLKALEPGGPEESGA